MSKASVGYGTGAAIGIGLEEPAAEGTGVVPDVYIPFKSESLKCKRAVTKSGTITGDRSVPQRLKGVREADGDIVCEISGPEFNYLFDKWNGNATGARTDETIAGFVTAAPTATVVASGTLAIATFNYCVETIWRGPGGLLFSQPASANSANATTVTGNQKVNLAWAVNGTVPNSPASDWAIAGSAIFRRTGAAPYQLLAVLSGSGTTYIDDGSITELLNVLPYTRAAAALHTWVKAYVAGQNPLPAVSITRLTDNDQSERLLLTRFNTFEVGVKEPNSPVEGKFGVMARDFEPVANPTPALTNLQKMMNWQCQVAIDGTFSDAIEAVTISGTNGCEKIPGCSGKPRYRDIGRGEREVTGTLGKGFEDHEFWGKMRDGVAFNLRLVGMGQPMALPTLPATYDFEMGAEDVTPFPYCLVIDAYNCTLSEAGGNVSGKGRIAENIQFGCAVDATTGTELRVRGYDLTPTY